MKRGTDWFRLCAALFVLSSLCSMAQTGEPFDHFMTAFPLTGVHTNTECTACHIGGQFKGTPAECAQCHDGSRAQGKPQTHVRTSSACDDCHTTSNFTTARFDHTEATSACEACHDRAFATDRSPRHTLFTVECDLCHPSTLSWGLSRFNHVAVVGVCESCHEHVTTDKRVEDSVTDERCDACHDRFSGQVAQFERRGVESRSTEREG